MIEIIATTLEDATKIEKCGANRIELVSKLSEGGLTPSYDLIKSVINSVNIPVNVMIRPHSRNFIYTKEDINIMIEDIKMVRSLKANGVVLGVLTKKNTIDFSLLNQILEYTKYLEVTFHRAIDECDDIINETNLLSQFHKVTRVLSSGGKNNAIDNIQTLQNMSSILNKNNIMLIAGKGITLDNMSSILSTIENIEIHIGTDCRFNKSCEKSINSSRLIKIVKKTISKQIITL